MEEDFTVRRLTRRMGSFMLLIIGISVSVAMINPGEEKRLIRKADEAFALEDYKTAKLLYIRAAEVLPTSAEAYYKLGILYVHLNQPKEAKANFEQALMLNPLIRNKVLLYLAEAHQQDYEFLEAKSYYEQEKKNAPVMDRLYQSMLRKRIEECIAGEKIMQLPATGIIAGVGAGINSEYSDYVPVPMEGNQAMLYTTRRPGKNSLFSEFAGAEQIRISKLKDGAWQASELFLETQRQMPYHAVVSVAPNGQELYTFFADKGLHISYKQENGQWSEPELLNAPFNRGPREPSIYVTDDGKFAFFSSDRAGGYGGLDIYVCYKEANGTWSEALNLGPEVNTAYNEEAPFVDFENNTLYFSSRGHDSMGGYDVFKSSIGGGKWSKAANLGHPVNSPADDLYFILNAERNTAYLASDRPGGLGGKDIYSIVLK